MPSAYPGAALSRDMVTIEPSAPYELLMGLHAVRTPSHRHLEWAERSREALGPELLEEIASFTEGLWHPLAISELPVDYAGNSYNASAFIDYVEGLATDDFLFYMWGRIIEREQVPRLRNRPEEVFKRFIGFYQAISNEKAEQYRKSIDSFRQICAAPEETQARLVRVLRAFNELAFDRELPELRRRWRASIAEKSELLERMEPEAFIARICDNKKLPEMFPARTPLLRVRVVPSWYLWKTCFEVWGYGTIFLIYNAALTEQRRQEIDRGTSSISRLASALSDPTRLRILRSVAQEPEVYGHKLSQLHGISQPAVSRHMGILKEAGLVSEEPRDGRIIYRLTHGPLQSLSSMVLNFLED